MTTDIILNTEEAMQYHYHLDLQYSILFQRGYQRIVSLIFVFGFFLLCNVVFAQQAQVDITRNSVENLQGVLTSRNLSIYGVTLGMPWSEARTVLDRQNVPYIFEKGSSPTVYIPPQNSTFYYVLNPSSYEVIEMGIMGTSSLPLDNQFLFDGQRWRLTTARTQFFGNAGEFILNEEGEAYNFPFKGVVLKYLTPLGFRFVLVDPTNKPLIPVGQMQSTAPPPSITPPPEGMWLDRFRMARDQFEAKRYKSALEEFRKIMNESNDQLLKIRSMYWMGECYYGMKQFANAKAQFKKVLAETDIASLTTPAKTMIARINRRTGKK